MGYCAGFDSPGFTRPFGMGGGGGRGRGGGQRGRRYGGGSGIGYGGGYGAGVGPQAPGWGPYPNAGYDVPPVDEASLLKTQADYLAQALKDVRDRLSALEDKE